MTKLVCVSDLHLDVVTDGAPRAYEIETCMMVASERAYDIMQGSKGNTPENVLFIFAGDLTDPHSPRCHRAIAAAVRCARGLDRHRIDSVWMTGNHDVFDDGSGDHTLLALGALGGGVAAVDAPHVLHIGGKSIVFLPFTALSNAYSPDEYIRQLSNPPDVVIGHLNLEGITPGSESSEYARGRSVYWPIEALRECCPDAMLIGGHYHERQVFQGVQIIGAMARLTHGEADHAPGFLVVDI